LNILGHRQLLAQPFLAEALGVQRDIFQDDRGLQGHGGQQVEILGLEADALSEPIELDAPSRLPSGLISGTHRTECRSRLVMVTLP